MTEIIDELEEQKRGLIFRINNLKKEEFIKRSKERLMELNEFILKSKLEIDIPKLTTGCLLIRYYKDEYPDYYEYIDIEFFNNENLIKLENNPQTYNRYIVENEVELSGFKNNFSDMSEEEFLELF